MGILKIIYLKNKTQKLHLFSIYVFDRSESLNIKNKFNLFLEAQYVEGEINEIKYIFLRIFQISSKSQI